MSRVLGASSDLLAVTLDVTTIVNPGFSRTELLTEQSTTYAERSIADYDERRGPLVE